MATIGSDPELFLRDQRTGQVRAAVGLIGGTKDKPVPVKGHEGYFLQEDNVMVEFNIPPATTGSRFARRILTGLEVVNHVVRTTGLPLELDIGACSRMFPPTELLTPQAQQFGCSPDFNAHEQGQPWPTIKPVQLEEPDGAWRFAGGHVHIGYESEAPEWVAAAFADVFLGLPSVSLDEQGTRRALYGQAGRYRPTKWGIEYRTLSNFWIWDEHLSKQIGDLAFALGAFLELRTTAEIQRLYAEVPWPDVRDAINKEDELKAADLLAYLNTDLGMEV